MPLIIYKRNITQIACDAMVNPTGVNMIPTGGVDAAIHAEAGPELLSYCLGLGPLGVGEARVTPAFRLRCRYVIHTAGPMWQGGLSGERALLRRCYSEAMRLAVEHGCHSVAFPLISSGQNGYPKDKVLTEAMDIITECLAQYEDMTAIIAVHDPDSYSIDSVFRRELNAYIDAHIEPDPFFDVCEAVLFESKLCAPSSEYERDPLPSLCEDRSSRRMAMSPSAAPVPPVSRERPLPAFSDGEVGSVLWEDIDFESGDVDDALQKLDKGFSDTLFYYIRKKGISEVDAYKRSNISKQTFSKINSNADYRPSKTTAISFAIGLRLDIDETRHLLSTAGMCLSRSDRFDLIIEYFITTGRYKDIAEVNATLFCYDMRLLGL